jgi:MAP/microtubule affinity-regulating kinase
MQFIKGGSLKDYID